MTETHATLHVRVSDWGLTALEAWLDPGLGLPAGQVARYEGSARAALAAAGQDARHVILWLAPPMVLEVSAIVPSMSRAQLRERVPYAVEDSLVDDLDTQHFALGEAERLASGQLKIPLRVTASEPLRALLQSFKALTELQPDAVYTEADALPAKPGDLQLWIEGDSAHLRHPDGRWLTTSPSRVSAALHWLSPGTSELGLWVIVSRHEREQWESVLNEESSRFAALRWHLSEGSPFCQLVRRGLVSETINLLQGELFEGGWTSRRHQATWLAWRRPILLVSAAVVLLIALDVTWSIRASQYERALELAVNNSRMAIDQSARDGLVEPATALSRGLGVAAAIKVNRPSIELTALTGSDRSLSIEFTDSGVGISNETLPNPTQLAELAGLGPSTGDAQPTLTQTERGWRWDWGAPP